MNLVRIIKRVFPAHRPVVTVQTYRVKPTDLRKKRNETHERLARELGREWKSHA